MAQLSHLLLFDPDPSGLDTLTYGFEKDGFSVTGTADAAKARDLILGGAPSLLVVNLRDQGQVGLDLLRSTTTNPRTRNLACVAIGREELRPRALAAGAFVFLSVPLFVRDVIGVCRMTATAVIPGSRPSPEAELSMKLGDLNGVYFLVRALVVTGRSAVVGARHGNNRGELRFMAGTLTSAQVAGVQGLPALHHMLLWEEADLHFKFRNVVRRGAQLSMKSGEVLEECDRFLRDFAHEIRDLGFARTVYAAGTNRVQPSPSLPGEVVPILKLLDGQRDLAQILDESPFRIFDTLKIIKRFVTDGAVELKTPPPAGRPATDSRISGPGALDFWFQRSAPHLGSELGAGQAGAGAGAQPVVVAVSPRPVAPAAARGGGSRPSSPFVALDGGAAASAAASPATTTTNQRPRTLTKNNAADPSSSEIFPEDMITPPPVMTVSDTPSKPTSTMARGEIRITPLPQRTLEVVATSVAPVQSVVVDLEPLPGPVPTANSGPSPLSAQMAPPSVIVAPMTPPPVMVTPASDGDSSKRHHRSPSDSFDAVESDFFEREADLYKRESVESFDDLDHSHGTRKR